MKATILGALCLLFLMLAGCASNTAVNHVPHSDASTPRKLVVFLDGTANSEGSHTNVAKLHNLVTLQDDPTILTSYIEGVGTNGKVVGMAMGWGIGHDVREAYTFLTEHYDAERHDEVYIFGFSRGAYAARILAAMVHVAGIPKLCGLSEKERKAKVKKIYAAYKSKKNIDERRDDVAGVLGRPPASVSVEFLGLWDTVEALGWPDYKENTVNPNPRYADQLCNIKKAAHALSIDDDRARIFTPILLTNPHLVDQCDGVPVVIDDVVDEVWFSGAHADVGGGYADTFISGNSLNWMLEKIRPYGIAPNGARVYADALGTTHDPESGLFGLIYHKRNRNLPGYVETSSYNDGKLKIHQSVLTRLAAQAPESFESTWFLSKGFKHCFEKKGKGYQYQVDQHCFTVVD